MTIHPRDLAPRPDTTSAPAPANTPKPTPESPAEIARHDGWSRAKQVVFLEVLASTQCVASAAREVGMSRQSAYRLRARLRGEPFDIAWDAAFQSSFDVLAEAAMDRALNGTEVPHFHNGELVHTSRHFDERLTIALLAQRLTPRRAQNPYQPGGGIRPDDFGNLLDRVAQGPATWSPPGTARLTYDPPEAAPSRPPASSRPQKPGDPFANE